MWLMGSGRTSTVVALEALYREQFHRFLRVAEAITGDADLARDAVQEAFARALRFRDSYRGEGPLEAWVWRIVANTARAAARGAARPVPMSEESDADSANGASTVEFRALLARLPERQRLMLFLRYYADLDYETIARIVGVRLGTVGATLNAARASLRNDLEAVRHG